jgi:hypothetical protein
VIPSLRLDAFLSLADAARAGRVFAKLVQHDTSAWVLAGGFALEVHRQQLGILTSQRTLHDIDFLVDSFEHIPATLGEDFVFRHIHPFDPPAKTLLQAVDLENAVRVDLFRAYGSVVERSEPAVMLGGLSVRIISLADIAARLARLCWDQAARAAITPKYARDLFSSVGLADHSRLEIAWQDHRQPYMPALLDDTVRTLQNRTRRHPDLLISSEYSQDIQQVCERCHEIGVFRLADPTTILSTLGYC